MILQKAHVWKKNLVLKCNIFWSSISLERIKWYLSCFSWSWSSSKGSIWKSSTLIGCCQVYQVYDSLIILWYLIIGREWSYILFLMHPVSYQGKVAFETTTFDCVWSDKLLVKLDYRILWPTISLKRIIWFLSFLMELVISDQICAPGQTGLHDFLVINIPGRNQFIPLSFFFYLFLCIIYQTLQESIWLWPIN